VTRRTGETVGGRGTKRMATTLGGRPANSELGTMTTLQKIKVSLFMPWVFLFLHAE
jgi:hypothetical protein